MTFMQLVNVLAAHMKQRNRRMLGVPCVMRSQLVVAAAQRWDPPVHEPDSVLPDHWQQ